MTIVYAYYEYVDDSVEYSMIYTYTNIYKYGYVSIYVNIYI